jgi:hypothetical protein
MRGNGGSCHASRMSHERGRRWASAVSGFRGEPEPMTTRAGDPSLIRRLAAVVSSPGLELSRSATYPRSLHIRLRSRAMRFFVACSGCDSQPRGGASARRCMQSRAAVGRCWSHRQSEAGMNWQEEIVTPPQRRRVSQLRAPRRRLCQSNEMIDADRMRKPMNPTRDPTPEAESPLKYPRMGSFQRSLMKSAGMCADPRRRPHERRCHPWGSPSFCPLLLSFSKSGPSPVNGHDQT